MRKFQCLTVFVLIQSLAAFVAFRPDTAGAAVTNLIDGTVSNAPGDFILGDTDDHSVLVITNAGVLAVANNGIIGNTIYGFDNQATVTGSGSTWSNTSGLYVGLYSAGNELTIANSGLVSSASAIIGYQYQYWGGAANNSVIVDGNGSVWTNTGVMTIGAQTDYNRLVITNGGAVFSGGTYLSNGSSGQGNTNTVIVTGAGSVWSAGALTNGYTGMGNRIIVSDGGNLLTTSALVGGSPGNGYNTTLITDPGSTWTNSGLLDWGAYTPYDILTISNGAHLVTSSSYIGVDNPYGYNNKVEVTGNGSVWEAGSMIVGGRGAGNAVSIVNSGRVVSTSASLGTAEGNGSVLVSGAGSIWTNSGAMIIGDSANSFGNSLVITNGGTVVIGGDAVVGDVDQPNSLLNSITVAGAGSSLRLGNFSVGNHGTGNRVFVQDGGMMTSTNAVIGDLDFVDANSNTVVVAGNNSVWVNDGGSITVGKQGSYNRLLITNGGLVEANSLVVGAYLGGTGNSISNIGGIYQFTTATPSLTPAAAGSISVTDGTVSFRGVGDAPVTPLSGLTYAGGNAFRLNSSSNATGLASYTFDTGLGASNYKRLEMINGSTLWRSGALTVGSGGSLLASNTTGTIDAPVISTGAISVVHSTMMFLSNTVIAGSYVSDPSTNTFLSDLTVTPSGSLAGGTGDLFDFKKNLMINSTNQLGFNLASSTVSFTGGGNHTNAVTGGDFGTNGLYAAGNFGYGKLSLGSSSDQIYFIGGGFTNNNASANALYIQDLDLLNDTNLVSNLHSSFNIYYLSFENNSFNTYLNDQTFSLDGGGFLMPVVPEPTTLLLVSLGGLLLARRRKNS